MPPLTLEYIIYIAYYTYLEAARSIASDFTPERHKKKIEFINANKLSCREGFLQKQATNHTAIHLRSIPSLHLSKLMHTPRILALFSGLM